MQNPHKLVERWLENVMYGIYKIKYLLILFVVAIN